MHKLRDTPGEIEADLKSQLEKIAGNSKVYVLGLGNTDRADDGAGVLVAQALKKLFPSYSFSEHDGIEGTVLDISEKDESLTVFFIDAADIGETPGAIRVVGKDDINDKEITTHRVAVALMSSILGRTGKISAVVCIQPERIQFRGLPSRRVVAAIDRLVVALSQIIEDRK